MHEDVKDILDLFLISNCMSILPKNMTVYSLSSKEVAGDSVHALLGLFFFFYWQGGFGFNC